MVANDGYCERLERLSGVWWKRLLRAQAPYRWNLRRLGLGFMLDVGCGIGRNLVNLDGAGVGVDLDADAVAAARRRGLVAYTTDEFPNAPEAVPGGFDGLLFAHVLEHMSRAEAATLIANYLPYLRDGGRVVVIVPQEAGFRSDPTHVEFLDEADVRSIGEACGLSHTRSYSFPFVRALGRLFRYNETVTVFDR